MAFQTSQTVAKLFESLSSAQAVIKSADKNRVNPHFKASYADLAAIMDVVREPLGRYGLCIIQCPTADGQAVSVTTVLGHSSGEFVTSTLSATAVQNTPQSIGSAISYLRRYAISAMLSIATEEDDDGNAASTPPPPRQTPPPIVFDPKNFALRDRMHKKLKDLHFTDDDIAKISEIMTDQPLHLFDSVVIKFKMMKEQNS